MKEIEDLVIPGNTRYTESHEWARLEGDVIAVGLTDYAQDQLGDIVFVELPGEDDHFDASEEFATVESVKAASEVYLPVAGTVVAINDELEGAPETVNSSPYEDAWLVKIKPDDPAALDALMDDEAYRAYCQSSR